MTDTEIAIAGGGLAGLALACLLAERGHRVLVLEKGSYPRHKVCGEYVSAEAAPLLQHLGVDLSRVPRLTRLRVTAPNGRSVRRPLPLGGYGISRFALDQWLYEAAIARGATFQTQTTAQGYTHTAQGVEVSTSAGLVTARLLVAASGRYSQLDKQLLTPAGARRQQGSDTYVGVKYHVQADLPLDLIELHNFAGGYAGISAVEEAGRYCLCYLTTSAALQKAGGIPQLQESVLARNPVLADYLARYPSLYEKPLAISQITFGAKPLADPRVFTLGDAAGMITPLCGNGMGMALHAAVLALPQVQAALANRMALPLVVDRYNRDWRKVFGTRLWAGNNLQRLFGATTLTNVSLAALGALPWLADGLISLTHGQPFYVEE